MFGFKLQGRILDLTRGRFARIRSRGITGGYTVNILDQLLQEHLRLIIQRSEEPSSSLRLSISRRSFSLAIFPDLLL